jgi:hypothetical protein
MFLTLVHNNRELSTPKPTSLLSSHSIGGKCAIVCRRGCTTPLLCHQHTCRSRQAALCEGYGDGQRNSGTVEISQLAFIPNSWLAHKLLVEGTVPTITPILCGHGQMVQGR